MPLPHGDDEAVDLTKTFVSIDSVSPSLVSGAPGEAALAHEISARLHGAGFAVELIPAPDDALRLSVVATHIGTAQGRTVVFNGHLDTVGVDDMTEPFTPQVEGDRLYGRGTSDMKAGLAALIVAAERLVADDHPGTIIVTCVADEEDGSRGASAVLAHLAERGVTPDVCLIAEPTWLDSVVAHRGYAVVEVSLRGLAAHSSQPDLGVDTIAALGSMLQMISRADTALRNRPAHPLLGHGSLMATVVAAGNAPFTIAAHAAITLERRTLPGERAENFLVDVERMLAELVDGSPRLSASARLTHHRESWEADTVGPGAEFSLSLGEHLRRLSREEIRGPDTTGAPYWMESALWQQAGVPCVVCGPAGGGLHAPDEWVSVEQVRRFADAVEATTRDFLDPSI